MEALIKHPNHNNNLLIWTLLCSILLHIAFAVVVPKFKFDPIKREKQTLDIELVQPKAPEPVAIPEPPTPEPIKPPPIKREIKPEPIKQPKKVEDTEPIAKSIETKPESAAPVPPPVIAATPRTEVKPEFVAPPPPPPEPPKATGPTESEINAAKNAYRNQVQSELKRNQRYPKIAQQRSIQGDVGLEISIDSDGNVTNVAVVESSGNDSLDNAAIDAVKRSNIKQYMKDILRGHVDKITVTVGFKLAS
ncbi:MAG: TonB family protein [Methylophilus sp.]